MTLMGKSNPLGGAVCAYTPGTILFDGSNGDSATLQMKKGFYFIRGQGAGAGGGNCGPVSYTHLTLPTIFRV